MSRDSRSWLLSSDSDTPFLGAGVSKCTVRSIDLIENRCRSNLVSILRLKFKFQSLFDHRSVEKFEIHCTIFSSKKEKKNYKFLCIHGRVASWKVKVARIPLAMARFKDRVINWNSKGRNESKFDRSTIPPPSVNRFWSSVMSGTMSISGNSNLIWLDNAINRANEMLLRTRLAHRRGQNHCCVTVPLRANLFIDESTFVCKSICRNSRTEIRIMTGDSLFLFTILYDFLYFFFLFPFFVSKRNYSNNWIGFCLIQTVIDRLS